MIIWFIVCLVGLVGHVANTAHGIGFVVGITWGFISAKIVT
jgi:membrane associated rhomboid family serine protease